jgi:hypothetical protein
MSTYRQDVGPNTVATLDDEANAMPRVMRARAILRSGQTNQISGSTLPESHEDLSGFNAATSV